MVLRCLTLSTGIGTMNSHLWRARDPPASKLGAERTSRVCSITEVFLALIAGISGGGVLRFTDVGRSKVLGADRSFIINAGVAAFGYAAGFKAADSSGASRMRQQLVAMKQLSPFGSRLLCCYLIFGKPMAILAAAQLGMPPASIAVHGQKLIARNGQDVTATAKDKWARSIVNNLLRTHVNVSLMFFRQAYAARVCVLHVVTAENSSANFRESAARSGTCWTSESRKAALSGHAY